GAAPAPGKAGKVEAKYEPDKAGESEKAYGDDANQEKKPPKPKVTAEATLAEAKAEGQVATFAGDHGKLLAGKASADVKASAEINGIRDMKAELAASASASGSVVQMEGSTQGRF